MAVFTLDDKQMTDDFFGRTSHLRGTIHPLRKRDGQDFGHKSCQLLSVNLIVKIDGQIKGQNHITRLVRPKKSSIICLSSSVKTASELIIDRWTHPSTSSHRPRVSLCDICITGNLQIMVLFNLLKVTIPLHACGSIEEFN